MQIFQDPLFGPGHPRLRDPVLTKESGSAVVCSMNQPVLGGGGQRGAGRTEPEFLNICWGLNSQLFKKELSFHRSKNTTGLKQEHFFSIV